MNAETTAWCDQYIGDNASPCCMPVSRICPSLGLAGCSSLSAAMTTSCSCLCVSGQLVSFVALTAAGPGCTDKGAASDTYQMAFAFGFAPDIITAGTCYFKRLVAKDFVITSTSVIPQPTEDPDLLPAEASSPEQQSYIAKELSWQLDAMAWFCLVHLTCIYLASKFLHTVPCGLLDIAE